MAAGAGVWYSGCKVRLKIRLENNSAGLLPPTPAPAVPGTGAEGFGSGSIDDVLPGTTEFIQLGTDIVPYSCTVELNSYRKADTAKFEIDFASLPIDPRLIRAMTVQVFAGVFTAPEWAAACGGVGADGLLIPDLPTPLTGVPDSFGGYTNEIFRGFADDATIVLNDAEQIIEIEARDLTGELLDAEIPPNMLEDLPGFLKLDEAIQLLLTGDGLAAIEIDKRFSAEQTKELGRKRKQLLYDRKVDLAAAADLDAVGIPAAAAAARASAAAKLAEANALTAAAQAVPPASRRFGLPGFRGLRVVNEVISADDPSGTLVLDLPTIDEIRPKAWVDSLGVAKKGRKKSAGNKSKIAYMDFISDLVTGAGYICYLRAPRGPSPIVATELVITNPRTYYRESETAGDGFPLPHSIRKFVWGKDISELTLKRNLKGTATPTIKVNGFDQATGTRYTNLYPPLAKNNRPTPTGDGDRDEIKVFNLDQIAGGSPDEIRAALFQAAASIYEQLSRGDHEVGIKTHNLSALDGYEGLIADLFALRPRDPIQIEIPAANPTSGVISSGMILAETSIAVRREAARRAGFDVETASMLAIAGSSQYLQREFRVQTVTWVWGAESGFDLSIQAINYLDVRDSVQITDARSGQPSAG
ncbi:MAG TPA: hypothetical protein VM869_35730 [Enhygromyxa sp.]|nr:hypothetical protein [Enhygromyxa sp.]